MYRLTLLLLAIYIVSCSISSCKQIQSESVRSNQGISESLPVSDFLDNAFTFTDPRDGEVYNVVTIGTQTWFSENLRYNHKASIYNLKSPSIKYGRMYTVPSLSEACPKGWHMPTDEEWDQLEIAHGMPASFIGKGGWRGEHASNMKSTHSWEEEGGGSDTLGFNVLPAGYFFSEKVVDKAGFEGLGYSAAFWSSDLLEMPMARFMFSAKHFVNKWQEEDRNMGTALSCRCLKD